MSSPRPVTVGDFKAGPLEHEYVHRVLTSGRLSYGPFSKRFEELWADAHGCKYAVFCNSGTSALHVAVQALKEKYGWPDGAEVIVPSVTFVATANVVLHNRLTPVFADVDPETYNLDPAQLWRRTGPKTVAVLPVHLTGLPANMPAVRDVAAAHDLRVIEDSCETTFASVGGRKVGAWGDVGCFSTYMAHYIVTGVGGLATTNDPDVAARLRSLVNHGRDGIYISIDDDDGLTGDKLREVISRRFRFVSPGHSFRATELEAALGVAQLERAGEIVARRKAVAARYRAGLADLTHYLQLPAEPPGHEHVYMMFPLVTRRGADKAGLVEHLETNGVETRDLLPLLGQPVYRKVFGRDLLYEYPVAAHLDACGFYVGCHQYIADEDADRVVDLIRGYFGRSTP